MCVWAGFDMYDPIAGAKRFYDRGFLSDPKNLFILSSVIVTIFVSTIIFGLAKIAHSLVLDLQECKLHIHYVLLPKVKTVEFETTDNIAIFQHKDDPTLIAIYCAKQRSYHQPLYDSGSFFWRCPAERLTDLEALIEAHQLNKKPFPWD